MASKKTYRKTREYRGVLTIKETSTFSYYKSKYIYKNYEEAFKFGQTQIKGDGCQMNLKRKKIKVYTEEGR